MTPPSPVRTPVRHPRTLKLHALMTQYSVDGPFVAHLLNRSLKTVHCWRAQSPSPISESMLELLELKLWKNFSEED